MENQVPVDPNQKINQKPKISFTPNEFGNIVMRVVFEDIMEKIALVNGSNKMTKKERLELIDSTKDILQICLERVQGEFRADAKRGRL